MDIRKFFGGGGQASQAAAPTATLSELKKKTQESGKQPLTSPVRSSPRKGVAAQKTTPEISGSHHPKTSEKTALSKKVVKDDDDSVIALSQSPPPKKKQPPAPKQQKRSSPRKLGSKVESEPEKPKAKLAAAVGDSKIAAKHHEKEKARPFQLLDDDDIDINDPDDDFVLHRSPKKAAGRKRTDHPKNGSTGDARSKDISEAGDEDGGDGTSDDGEVVRKKAKVNSSKKRKTDGRDSADADDEKPTKKASAKKTKEAAVKILDSDEEDGDIEQDASFLKHERRQKQAMKKALQLDSHGMRNQDISVAVTSVSSAQRPKEVGRKVETVQPVKEMSAASFFGIDPVKYQRNSPKQSPEVLDSTRPASPMAVDSVVVETEQRKPSTLVSKKETSPKKKTPQSHATEGGRKQATPSSSGHAPLSPKVTGNHGDSSSKSSSPAAKSITPTKSPGKPPTTTTPPTNTAEKKRSSYFSYINREGPKHLGEKDFPVGSSTCLEGLSFVLTGILESFERDDVKAALEKMGARVVASVSKKTSYVVVGREAGVAKLDKIRQLNIPQLDEDRLIELVTSKIQSSSKTPGTHKKTPAQQLSAAKAKADLLSKKEPAQVSPVKTINKAIEPEKCTTEHAPKSEEPVSAESKLSPTKRPLSASLKPLPTFPTSRSQPIVKTFTEQKLPLSQPAEPPKPTVSSNITPSGSTELWVDKYKPKSIKTIVGQQGDRSCVNKLMSWLRNWNRNIGVKPNMNPYAQNPDGAGLKAALLSGPPGIGKTTSAHLVCKDLGISVVEMNASDTRSKKSLESWVSALLQSKSMDTCGLKATQHNPELPEHCLIMDEVDGMAGNEDRGGIAELIGLIKKSKIPVICICNDRAAQKIRSLANYCFDLRFYKPRPEQIKAAMLSMACREGVKIPPEFISEVIEATNSDIRQVINQLQMYSSQNKGTMATYHARKDVRMGIFQLSDKIFSYEENKAMSVPDRMELFFQDYSLVPLFVQENYASVWPHKASSLSGGKNQQRQAVRLLAQTANALSYGDVFERQIRSSNDWSLLSGQAVMSCALPSYLMSGTGRVNNFPGWFGKTSHASRIVRIIQQVALHTSLATGVAGKTNFALDYVPALHRAVIGPLLSDGETGAQKVIEIFEYYDLIREDLDALLEVDQWPNKPDEWKQVDSKIKASLTRQYNKSGHKTHYAMTVVGGGAKKRGAPGAGSEEDYEGLVGEEEETSKDGVSNEESSSENEDDPMIKANVGKGRGRGTSTAASNRAGRGASSTRGGRGGRGAKK